MNQSLQSSIFAGSRVRVQFGGGIEGRAAGQVTELIRNSNDVRFVPDADFWDPLSRRWHRKGDSIIVHLREIKEVLP